MLIIIGGPAGCGKSTVGEYIASALQLPFLEGDDLHPESNRAKMAAGIPLNDADRQSWLQAVAVKGRQLSNQAGGCVATCSALKKAYRDAIRDSVGSGVGFLFLIVSPEVLTQRLLNRKNHFMKADMLQSQLSIWEPPSPDEENVAVMEPLPSITESSAAALKLVIHEGWAMLPSR